MNTRRYNQRILLAFAIIAILCSTLFGSQQVDPFYRDVLDKGEQLYLEGDYKSAIKKFNVAVFGLHGAYELQAKAYVYLCLSHFYLREKDESQMYLKEAEKLMDIKKLLSLDITDAARNDLERIIYTIKAGSNPVSGLRMLPKLPEEITISNPISDQRQLEQSIRKNPRNPSFYYELYNIHRENYNYSGAKKTIEDLVKNIPSEMYGHYLLGIIYYQEKEYDDAIERFKDFYRLSAGVSLKEKILTEVIAYQILSNYLKGNRGKAQEIITQNIASLTSDKNRALPLSEKDKRMLQGIVDTYLR